MKTVEYLRAIYPTGAPIFLKDVRIGRKSKSAIKQELYRAAKRGEISREANGVYFFPETNSFFPNLSFEQIVEKKYISDDCFNLSNSLIVYGYYSHLTAANDLGLSTQVPAIVEIVTNKTSSKKRTIELMGRKAIIRKSNVEITFQNWRILQFFSALQCVEDKDVEERKEALKVYITKHFTKFLFTKYISLFPNKVLRILLKENLLDAFR